MQIPFCKIFAILTCLSSTAFAETWMPRIFSDNMVLQRDEPVNIWGASNIPDAEISVKIGTQNLTTVCDKDGRWLIKLNPMSVSTEPLSMEISENGKIERTIKNILVGEVWIIGGQSNMAYPLSKIDGGIELSADANDSTIRYFDQGNSPLIGDSPYGRKPEYNTAKGTKWLVCSPKTAESSFRAIPYIFARDISKELKVPIGIVYTAIPGTKMVSWISQDAFENNPNFEIERKAFEARVKNYDYGKAKEAFEKLVATYDERVAKAKAEGKRPPDPWSVEASAAPWPDSPDRRATPALLYNVRIFPIRNFTARGFLWYQGESDQSKEFSKQFAAFIEEWRKEWNKPNMPFLFVQLPSYSNKYWPIVRQEQMNVFKNEKNIGIVTAIDTGDFDDIHPRDKMVIGERLAKVALHDVYKNNKIVAYGPIFKSAKFDKDTATVEFSLGKNKLKFKGTPRGFEILSNGKWLEAAAKIVGDTLEVKSPQGEIVEGVRYLFKSWTKPDVSLYNDADLPAFPFTSEK